jgi:hypothetical protein
MRRQRFGRQSFAHRLTQRFDALDLGAESGIGGDLPGDGQRICRVALATAFVTGVVIAAASLIG